jgi:hypothetical protein
LKIPKVDEFEALLDETQGWAESVEYKESDVNEIIKSVKKSKR